MLQGGAPVQEQERNLSSISLPPDIECLIVEQFDVNEAKLRKLALVYHVWTSYAQLLLFREIVICDLYSHLRRTQDSEAGGTTGSEYLASEVALIIHPCTALETLSLSVQIHPARRLDIISYLSQLTSPHLRTISIQVVLVRDAKDLHIFWQQLESVLLMDRFRSLESVVVNIQELVYKDDLPTAYPKVLERYLATIHARGLLRITYSSSPAYTPPTRRDRLGNACKEIVHKFKHRVRWH